MHIFQLFEKYKAVINNFHFRCITIQPVFCHPFSFFYASSCSAFIFLVPVSDIYVRIIPFIKHNESLPSFTMAGMFTKVRDCNIIRLLNSDNLSPLLLRFVIIPVRIQMLPSVLIPLAGPAYYTLWLYFLLFFLQFFCTLLVELFVYYFIQTVFSVKTLQPSFVFILKLFADFNFQRCYYTLLLCSCV